MLIRVVQRRDGNWYGQFLSSIWEGWRTVDRTDNLYWYSSLEHCRFDSKEEAVAGLVRYFKHAIAQKATKKNLVKIYFFNSPEKFIEKMDR